MQQNCKGGCYGTFQSTAASMGFVPHTGRAHVLDEPVPMCNLLLSYEHFSFSRQCTYMATDNTVGLSI